MGKDQTGVFQSGSGEVLAAWPLVQNVQAQVHASEAGLEILETDAVSVENL